MNIQRYRLELHDPEADCEMVKDSAGDLCEWEDVELLEKKLEGLENIDEVSAGYRDLCKKMLKEMEEESCGYIDYYQKEFDEVGE